MSKHRRRSEERRNEQQINNSNPYSINPQQQLMDIIGNIGNGDMSQIANLLSSLNGDGVNFNNLNMNSMGNTNTNNSGNVNGNNIANPLNINPSIASQDFNPLQLLLSGLAGGGMPFPNIANKKGTSNQNINQNKIKEFEKDNEIEGSLEFKEELEEEELEEKAEVVNSSVNEDDDIIKMLKSIKVFVEPKRVKFIDRIIELYLKGQFDDVI